MDSIKMPKADLSQNDPNLDEQLDEDLSQLGDKKIEVVESSGLGKRKIGETLINENKSFLAREKQIKEIKNKKKEGNLISNQEASLLREADLDRKKSSSTENKSEEEKEPNQEQTVENLKKEVDQAFQELLKGDSEFREIKKKRGLFKKTLAILGIGKEKDTSIKKELEEQEKAVEELKEKYEAKFNEFSQKLVKEREQELKDERNDEASMDNLIGSFAFDGRVISVDKKLENEETEIEKISTMEYFNRNQKKLLENRERFLSEKQREILKKISGKYNSLSKTKKIIYGVGLSATAGATVMLAGGAAVSVALGYGAWRGGKTLLRRATVGALSGVAIKGINAGLTKRTEKKNIADLETAKGEFVGGLKEGQFDLFNILSEQNKKERKRDRNRKIAVGVTIGTLFGTAIGAEAMLSGEVLNEIPGDDGRIGSGGVDLNKIPGDVEEVDIVSKDKIIADKINEDKVDVGIKEKEGLVGKSLEENYNKGNVAENLELNNNFELKPGGNVWNSLSEHFDGNKQKVGKVLAGFRAETMKDLMENQGMSEVQADQFIEWRYRHMDVGTDFSLKDGKLEIPGFDDERKITRFEKTEFNNQDSLNETMENSEKTRVERFDDIVTKENVDIPAPVETVEMLDPKISTQVDQNIKGLVEYVYGGQAYEWDVMKNKNAWDIINGEYGNPIKAGYGEGLGERVGVEVNEVIESERGMINNNDLDQAEITNRKELRGILLKLIEQNEIQPEANETVEQFIRRVEIAHYTQNISENISGNTTVEVPEPTETVEIMDPDISEQIEKIYGQQNSEWEAVKDRSVEAFVDNKYDDSKLSQVEVKRNEELKELLLNKIKETGEFPESGGNFGKPESIEEYLIRVSKS